MNWVQIENNFTSINDNKEIVYTPPTGEETLLNILSEDKSSEILAIKKYTSQIKSSEYFENGLIECDVKVEDSRAFVRIELGQYIFFINSRVSNSAYAIRLSGNQTAIVKAGEYGSVPINKSIKIKISVTGSQALFLINDVVVCEANVVIVRSQIVIGLRSIDKITIKNFKINSVKPKAFVVMQFTEEYNKLYSDVIFPICEEFGYDCKRGDEYFTSGIILKDITDAINDSSIIIADITPNNSNVFYEVGYAHALNKPTILLSDKKRPDMLPFDISGFRTLFYDNTIGGKKKVEDLLRKHLTNINSEKQYATL